MNDVVHTPAGFAGGEIRQFNRILWAWARSPGDPTVVVHPSRDAVGAPLGLLGPEGDLLPLPPPEGGVFADDDARRAWAAAILDWLPELRAEAAAAVEAMLPAPGEEPLAATVALWRATFPGLRVEAGDAPSGPESDEGGRPRLVWIGEHQRRAAAELGTTPEAALRAAAGRVDDAEGASGPPLDRRLLSLRSEIAERLDELVELATAADLGLHGPARRTRRLALRELDALAERLANAEANRRGIRGRRTRRLLQALAPDGRPQEEALSLLAARALFRLPAVVDDRFLARVRERTTAWTGEPGEALVLEA